MKYLFIIALSFCLSSTGIAQDAIQKWRFGVGGGFNTMRLTSSVFNTQEKSAASKSDHPGFQGNILTSHRINKSFRLVGKLGVTRTNSLSYRTSENRTGGFLSAIFSSNETTTTTLDTVSSDNLFLDIPLFIRWQIWPLEDYGSKGIKPFMDLGLSFKIPLNYDSEYSQAVIIESRRPTTRKYNSGTLINRTPRMYFAVGFYAGKHVTLSYSWAGVGSKADKTGTAIKFSSTIRSLTLDYLFSLRS